VSTFTDDGRFVTWFAPMGTTNQTNQVFLYDFQLGTNVLVSRSFISGQPGNRESDAPCISSDGRFLAYRSAASDLVPGDTNDVPDVFLYDRVTGSTTLVSVNGLGSAPGNNRSFGPQFSPDARMLLFQSWASDLAANDFNHYADIFALSLSTSNAIAAFEVQIYQGPGPNRLPTLTWLAVPGVTYSVETKQALTDSGWQVADGQVAILGERAYFADLVPGTAQKFYRVIAH
jgi:Tol biopolymer transport system component